MNKRKDAEGPNLYAPPPQPRVPASKLLCAARFRWPLSDGVHEFLTLSNAMQSSAQNQPSAAWVSQRATHSENSPVGTVSKARPKAAVEASRRGALLEGRAKQLLP